MFIEVTNKYDEIKELINVNSISRIYQEESDICDSSDLVVFISFVNGDENIEIAESYENIKKMFKKTKSTSIDEIDRFQLIDMDED